MTREPVADGAGGTVVLPQDLVDGIARHLEDAGEYRVTLEPGSPQRVIDLRWAALAASRRLGRRVNVAVTRAGVDVVSALTTVRMTCAPAIPLQREPLQEPSRY
jgi:hypothetical protein